MKYMVLMHANPQEWDSLATAWAPEDVKRMVDYMHEMNRELRDSGELVDANGLSGPAECKTVWGQPDGEPLVTDGPFPEAKEVLAGYWLVDVATVDRAVQIAARASAAPGAGGTPAYQPVEVHPVGEAPQV